LPNQSREEHHAGADDGRRHGHENDDGRPDAGSHVAVLDLETNGTRAREGIHQRPQHRRSQHARR
jgi:hypothetical protein